MIINKVEFRKAFANIGAASVEVHITLDTGIQASAMRIDDKLPSFNADAAVHVLKKIVAPLLKGQDISQQREIDDALEAMAAASPDAAPFIPSVSQAALQAGAASMGLPLCDRLRSLCGLKGMLPMPTSGAIAAGVNFKGDATYQGKPWWGYIATGFDNTDDAVNALWVVQRKWQDLIKRKFKVKVSTHSGNLFYPESFFPTIEQLCDSLAEAIHDSGFDGQIGIFADLAANERFNPETGCYHGLLEQQASQQAHLEKLLQLCGDYPVAVLLEPLGNFDAAGYAQLEKACPLVASETSSTARLADIFDSVTVSQAIGLVLETHRKGAALIPRFSLTPGFQAMDYYAAFEAAAAFRCGMTDYANRAMALSSGYRQRQIQQQNK